VAEFKVKGKQMITKKVCKQGTGAVVYVPRIWLGKYVAVILEGE